MTTTELNAILEKNDFKPCFETGMYKYVYNPYTDMEREISVMPITKKNKVSLEWEGKKEEMRPYQALEMLISMGWINNIPADLVCMTNLLPDGGWYHLYY